MRIFILMASLTFGICASARTFTSVPPEAERLYNFHESSTLWSEEELRNAALKKMSEAEAGLDLELNCSAILYVWDTDKKITCYEGTGWGPGGCLNPFNQAFGSSEFRTNRKVSLEAYCVKRSFDQKMLVSLVRQCEANPTMECYQLKDTFKEIQPLKRFNLKK